ncbi:MAG: hypothetical protein CVT49_02525 [candidate division Zixibacteria bacterium HGW-Zixibacteria-1]|nr:MAG: hypothetical protein CVT49_02525 [candidate division Zixibacteria bacterium HGW-Zixibacteria-1]
MMHLRNRLHVIYLLSKLIKLIIFRRMKGFIKIFKEHPILAVLVLGFIYRLIFLLSYLYGPEWEQLLVDSLFHDRWAEAIASGHILGDEVYFRAPFYIYILGFIYTIFGHSLLAARIFGHLVGLVSVFLTWRIAGRLFSPRVGLIAALIHALYPIAVYFESELLVDSFFTMLAQLSLWLLMVSGDSKQYRGYIWVGIITGVAAITRPLILALIPIYMLWIFVDIRPLKASLQRIVLFLLATFLIILPVTIRNYIVADDFVLVASSGGVNFYIGNNAAADGLSAAMPAPLGRSWEIKDIDYLAETETGRNMRASEISDYWFDKGIQWIMENPGNLIKLYIKKLYYCINGSEVSNNRNLNLFLGGFSIFKFNPLNFAIIFALAVFSIVLMMQHHLLNGERLLILLFIILYFALIAIFFINARFRLPAVPYIIIFAAYGVEYLTFKAGSGRILKKLIPAFVVGCAAYLLAATNIYGLDKSDIAGGYFNRANFYLYQNQLDRASENYRLALHENPGFPDASLNLGVVFLRLGQGDSAKFYFMQEMKNSPDNPRAYINMASIYYLEGDYDRAEEMARTAQVMKPYFADAYIMLMRIYHAIDNRPAFEEILRRAVESAPDDARVYLNAGLIYSDWKMYNRAEEILTEALKLPDRAVETDDLNFNYSRFREAAPLRIKARAAYQLGYIYGIQDRIPESIIMSRQAIDLDSSLVEAYINLINAYSMTGETARAKELMSIASKRFPENDLLNQLKERYR